MNTMIGSARLGRGSAWAGFVFVWVLSSVWSVAHAPPGGDARERPSAVLLVTGAVEGYVDQCGCPKNPMGGLDKRAGYLIGLRRVWPGTPLILLDSGNFSDGPSPGGKVKTRGLIEGMDRLGYSAAGVGERELRLEYETFKQLAAGATYPFLSANVIDAQSRQPAFVTSTSLVQGGLRFAVTSVARENGSVEARPADGRRVVIGNPVESLAPLVPKLRIDHDIVVVLAALSIEEATVIAQKVPGIDLIIGAFAGRTTDRAEVIGSTHLMYVSDQGKAFGQVEIYSGRGSKFRFETRLAGLGDAVPSDDAMERFVVSTMQAAQEADVKSLLPADEASGDGAARFVGVGACTSCHALAVGHWVKTKHASAWKTLERAEDGEPNRLQCIGCHSVGFGTPSGFRSYRQTPHLAAVGCESCHGPGSAHLTRPEAPYGKTNLGTCTACHNAENDPRFNYYEALRTIAHPGPN